VPVVSRDGEVLGGLFFGHAEPARFTETHERIVAGIAGQAAVALENARLYAALRKSETAAREAERRKDEFLAMLGHELRNPLAPIVTALDLMTMRGAVPKEARVIDRHVRHMIRLVDDLLDLSRVTSGKVELKRARVDIASCLARAVEMASPLIEQRRHRISLELADGPLLVNGDATRLGQVFANLLNNAAKYTEPGGRIVVSARREGAAVRTSVRDDGIGIRADLLPHVFDAFVQNPRSLDRSQGGLGVGLAIVRSLVERHGGSVEAKSAGQGHGTEVVVTLPALGEAGARAGSSPGDVDRPGDDAGAGAGAQPGAEPGTAEAAGAASEARPRKRVLVVDDNADAAELVAELLRERGHEVVVAEDGPSALRVAERFVPDVAILDIGLPVMNGYELAAELRRGPARAARLIAVTGYGQASDRARAEAAGFAVHLVKPVDFAALESSVES
jgi:signal transduction histidine kinase